MPPAASQAALNAGQAAQEAALRRPHSPQAEERQRSSLIDAANVRFYTERNALRKELEEVCCTPTAPDPDPPPPSQR